MEGTGIDIARSASVISVIGTERGRSHLAIDWQRLPARDSQLPFNGDQVLLAVPHIIGSGHGGDGNMLDPDCPFTLHLARWDAEKLEWATNETDEATGAILWINPLVSVL